MLCQANYYFSVVFVFVFVSVPELFLLKNQQHLGEQHLDGIRPKIESQVQELSCPVSSKALTLGPNFLALT